MINRGSEDDRHCKVVVNDEELYALGFVRKSIPLGWSSTGNSGPKVECLDYMCEVWTAMAPLSLHQHIEGSQAKQGYERRLGRADLRAA